MTAASKFDFTKNYVLQNERVHLSVLTAAHFEDLKKIAKAPEVWTYFLEKGLGAEAFDKYINAAIEQREKGTSYPFVVFDKRENQIAGLTRLYDYIPDLGSIKIGHTWYGTAFWGNGMNKHCKYLLFKFGFETLELERIGFGVHGENLRSVAALKSVGVSEEGVLRNFLPSIAGDKRVDLLHLSILKAEWFQRTKATLEQKINKLK